MADESVLPICYCKANDGAHVHLPWMQDSLGQWVHLSPNLTAPEPEAAPAPAQGADAEDWSQTKAMRALIAERDEALRERDVNGSALTMKVHELREAVEEADRLRHGVGVEGDFVCPDSLRALAAEAEVARLRAAPPPGGERERALIAAWRAEASDRGYHSAHINALNRCAAELEAALSAPAPAQGAEPGRWGWKCDECASRGAGYGFMTQADAARALVEHRKVCDRARIPPPAAPDQGAEPCEHHYDPFCRDPQDRCIRCGFTPPAAPALGSKEGQQKPPPSAPSQGTGEGVHNV